MIEKYIGGRRCAILGLGVSHTPLARLLNQKNISLTVYDGRTAAELGKEALELEKNGVSFVVADKEFDGVEGDIIFRSPGIRPDRRGLLHAVGNGAELISETELFLKLTPASTYAVTGSDGKTTTTTLVGKFLSKDGGKDSKTYVGGNIGTPLVTLCTQMSERDNAVLELSSFQLMTLSDAPRKVAITNVSENHLDWHTDMREYVEAKKRIVGERTERLVTNADCAVTADIALEMSGQDLEIALFSSSRNTYEDVLGRLCGRPRTTAVYVKDGAVIVDDGKSAVKALDVSDIQIPGRHNVENFMTAIALTWQCVAPRVYSQVARSFFGVEHRLELVRELDGVRFYNSSIDSSPTRTAAALSAMSGKSIVLISGGYDKNLDYAPLARAIYEHGGVHTLVLTGATADKIEVAMTEYRQSAEKGADVRILRGGDFSAAVELARESARRGDCVVLSPASASFDAFKNFMERGNTFKSIVNRFE